MDTVRQLTAVIEREGDGYVATCPEFDIVSQGGTVEEARHNLVEAVEGFFEVASASEVRRRLKTETYVVPIMPTVPDRLIGAAMWVSGGGRVATSNTRAR
jgi:predicted RNase H-like HicB family nuclease